MYVDILSYTVEQAQSIIVTLFLVSIAAKRTKIVGPGRIPMHDVHTPYSSVQLSVLSTLAVLR